MIPAPRESGYTTTTTIPLYWCAYGPAGARRLLVLHGGPGADHQYLLPQMLALATDYELVFYDQRGGGRSRTDDPAPITWQTHVDDLAAVATEFVLATPDIVGYSWGALLAMLFTTEMARRDMAGIDLVPASLTLLDPAPVTRELRQEFEAEFTRRQQGEAVQQLRAELAASDLRERDPDAYRQRAF